MVFSSRGGSSPGGRHAPPWDLSNLGAQTSHFLSFPQDIFSKQIRRKWHTVFPWIIPGGDYFFFRIKRGKGGDYSREGDYFSYCSLDDVPKIYIYIQIFLIPLNQAIITSNKLNMGFLSVPNWVPGLIFGAWIITHQFCWIRFHFNFTRRVQKKEKMTRGVGWGGGWLLFEGGDYFKYFHQRGAIIRGRRLIEGRLFFKEIRWLVL